METPPRSSDVNMERGKDTAAVVIVGGGPRGSGLLERLAANASEFARGRRVEVHVIEPFTPGAGRIWRHDQSQLLWANSQAVDMTMFTDDSCTIEGKVRPGPTFLEWAHLTDDPSTRDDEELEAERRAVQAMTFPSRPLLSAYLHWCFEQAVAEAENQGLSVHVHHDRAVRLAEGSDGRQEVHLAGGGAPVPADVVILAQGHLPRRPTGPAAELVRLAGEQGLTYLPETFTSEADLSALHAGQEVIVRGAGLAFIDLLVRLTQGRGGRFTPSGPDGRLRYEPSGQEPRLHVGSRRGVPYHSKLTYPSLSGPFPELRFLTQAAVESLLSLDGERDFRQDIYPLFVKELAFRHYHELFTAHPGRVNGTWPHLLTALDELAWGSPQLRAAVEAAVPDPADRFEPEKLDHPLDGVRLPDRAGLQQYLKDYVLADVARRADPRFSPDLAVFLGLLAVLGPLGVMIASNRLSTASSVRDLPWFLGFFSYLASGPPPRRLEEIVALMDAGVLTFLGADVEVDLRAANDTEPAAFAATSPSVPGTTHASALVEARIPRSSLPATDDELLADLYRRGEVSERMLADVSGIDLPTGQIEVSAGSFHLVQDDGRVHPNRYALGAGTGAAGPGAFSRPGTNAAFFRQNDAVARDVLESVNSCSVQVQNGGS
jgi:uncharacterized NAD(P)/FAD-binding protein YdhS